MNATIEIDLTAWNAAMEGIAQAIQDGADNPEINRGMSNALDAQDEFLQDRFLHASTGDGTWTPLATSTIKQRQRGGNTTYGGFSFLGKLSPAQRLVAVTASNVPILIITGDKYRSLRVGDTNHFGEQTKDWMSSGSIAPNISYHQQGGGNLPARPIIVPPDESTEQRIAMAVQVGIGEAIIQAISRVSNTGETWLQL